LQPLPETEARTTLVDLLDYALTRNS
jgi:hypothetical protein